MKPNQGQWEAWNGAESVHYVDHADRYDRQLVPFTDAMLARAGLTTHDTVLDVGCGCGSTTLAAAAIVDSALGVDISQPLIDVATARARAAAIDNADFVVADAQTLDFERAYDVIVSQFGLMFFDDPEAAFAHLRHALVPGGRIVFVSWQALEANEWLMALGRALAPHVPLPALGGLAAGPGMFALKDADETIALLDAAGFAEAELTPIEPTILLGGGGSLGESVDFLLGTGIARGLLGRAEPESRAEVTGAVHDALEPHYESGVGVALGAAGWLVSAYG